MRQAVARSSWRSDGGERIVRGEYEGKKRGMNNWNRLVKQLLKRG